MSAKLKKNAHGGEEVYQRSIQQFNDGGSNAQIPLYLFVLEKNAWI